MHNYWTADIETMRDVITNSALTGKENYVSWCTHERKVYGSDEITLNEFIINEFLIEENKGMRLYFHNGFRFDLLRADFNLIANYCDSKGLIGKWITDIDGNPKALNIYNRKDLEEFKLAIEMKKTNKYLKVPKLEIMYSICDSILITTMSLDNLTKKFSPEFKKQKREKSFDEYPFNPNDLEDVKYAKQDALSLHHALEKFDNLISEHFETSIEKSYTAAGLAMKIFKSKNQQAINYASLIKTNKKGIKYEAAKDICEAAKLSYSGGMTLAFDSNYNENIIGIDCNSMYPYVMLNYNLPAGKAIRFQKNVKLEDIREDDLIFCDIEIPNNCFPVLKSLKNNGNKDVKGNWCGIVNNFFWGFEIAEQLKQEGCKLIKTYCLYRWNDKTDCVKQTIQKFKDLRFQDYNGPLGAVAKLLGNSLYGKFAQRNSNATRYCTNIPSDEMLKVGEGIYKEFEESNSEIDLTHWASYICARARVHLFQNIQKIGIENVIYCDTDSIYFKKEYLHCVKDVLGDEYGLFKIERELNMFKAYAPKAYTYIDNEGNIGGKNKGIPKNKLEKLLKEGKKWEEIEKIDYVSLNSMRVVMDGKNELGKLTSRKLATIMSITNGYFNEKGKWQPVNTEIGELSCQQ